MLTRSAHAVTRAARRLSDRISRPPTVEIAPNVFVTRRRYWVPADQAPFYNFPPDDVLRKIAEQPFVREFNERFADPWQARRAVTDYAWEALGRQDFVTAGRRLNQAFLVDPVAPDLYHGWAWLVGQRFGDFAFAEELFSLAATADEPAPEMLANWASIRLAAGRLAEAKTMLESLIEQHPDWNLPKFHLAWVFVMMRDRPGACRVIASMSEISEADISASPGLADNLAALKKRARYRT